MLPRRADHRIDVTDIVQVRRFVEVSDALGGPDSKAVCGYWDKVEFLLPDWVRARARTLHPLSAEYFGLQDQLHRFMTGTAYSLRRSEFTGFDKQAAAASPLAYPDRTPRALNRYMLAHAKFADRIACDEPCDALEIGSGWGFSAEYLARLGHRVTGIDINPDFVEVASGRSAAAGLGIDYRLGTFENLQLRPGERFDLIYCFEAFHHARDFAGVLRALVGRLRPKGQFILFGEPFIPPTMWPSWGLRLDPISIYCIAKFGWWESGWTQPFMAFVFRTAGLSSRFIDERSDLERYMIGEFGAGFDADQASLDPQADGWSRDRHYLVCLGRSRVAFHRPLRRVVLEVENFGPRTLAARICSAALPAPIEVAIVPGPNEISVPLSPCASREWDLRIDCQTWNPRRVLGEAAADMDMAFHLSSIREED